MSTRLHVVRDEHASLGESGDYWRGWHAAEAVVRGECERALSKREAGGIVVGLAFGCFFGIVMTGLVIGWFQ